MMFGRTPNVTLNNGGFRGTLRSGNHRNTCNGKDKVKREFREKAKNSSGARARVVP